VIPTVITQLAKGKRQVKLGAAYPTRDFSYVTDTIRGFIAAISADCVLGEVINLGSNHEISIGETVKIISEIMRVDVDIITEQERLRPEKGEVERLFANNSKAKRLLNWSPEYSGRDGFRRGLAKTIEWFSDPQHLSSYKSDIYNL
jgi:dTDP-glucose 4,6-dehydratase